MSHEVAYVVLGVVDTTGRNQGLDACHIVSVDLLDDTGTAAPREWLTVGQRYELRFDGTGWMVSGGWIGRDAVYRLTRAGRYITTIPTLHGDERLDPTEGYALVPVPGRDATWHLRRTG